MLRISLDRAVERAKLVQPPDTEVIELRCLPDGQWVALYMTDESPVQDYESTCYRCLEYPLFNLSEL